MPSNLERAYQCEACDMNFSTEKEQNKHRNEKHSNDNMRSNLEKTYQCEACDVDLSTEEYKSNKK